MWRDPRQNRWQQRVNKQAKRAADRDEYLTELAKREQPVRAIYLPGQGILAIDTANKANVSFDPAKIVSCNIVHHSSPDWVKELFR